MSVRMGLLKLKSKTEALIKVIVRNGALLQGGR